MPYRLDWYNPEKTAILRVMERGWTWDEFDESYYEAFKMVRSVKHRVHVISDYSTAPDPVGSGGGGMIERFGKIWSEHPQNIGLMIIVSAASFQQSMGEVFSKTFGGQTEIVRYVKTMEEADAVLAELGQ
jgi:hypothetical protein